MAIAVQTFYTPLPRFGVKLSDQWNLFREDFDHIAPLVRAAYADINSNNDSENDLAGLAIGELDFRNRYRIFYDKDANAFLLQYNTGTESSETWVTRYTIRDSDGRLIVNSPGGLQSVSGFYNLGGIDLFVTQSGGFSFEDAGALGFDSGAGFYFTIDSSGRPVLSLVAEAAAGTVTDGNNVGSQAEVFKDKSGTTLRFRTLAGSGLLTVTENTNTIDFATSAENNTGSNLGSGTGIFESKVASDLRFKSLVGTGGIAISSNDTEVTIDSSANKFYGVIFKESESGGRVERDDTLVFDSEFFYLTQAGDDGKPLLSLSKASTGRNLGNGEGVYASQEGLEFRFKSITTSGKIKVSSDDNEIEISSEFYLNDLLDVNVPAPSDDQVLTYSSEDGEWVAGNKVLDPTNVIINGNFDIWQRGTSFDKIDNFRYSADRWLYFYRGAAGVDGIDIDRDSTLIPDGRTEYSLKITVDTADASIASDEAYVITQPIEGFNIQRFGFGSADAQKLTVSFKVRASVAGTYYVFLKNSLEGTGRTYLAAYTISAADTWETKTITLTADTAGSWNFTTSIGLVLGWTLACGSGLENATVGSWISGVLAYAGPNQANLLATANNTFNLAQVQLELGGSAGNFHRRLIGEELQLCQRYYAKTFRSSTTPADGLGTTGAVIGKSVNGGGVDVEPLANWFLPVTMRAVPTVTLFNTRAGGKIGQWQVGSTGDTDNARVISTSETIVVVDNTGIPPSGSSAQQAYIHIVADAEL